MWHEISVRRLSSAANISKKIDCLEHRLRTTGKAAVTLADNPLHQQSESALESASDVREDFAELKRGLARLRELNRLLND